MNDALMRQLIWLDYRLALIFTALIPLALLIWALRSNDTPHKRSLLLYWRVASMVLITIALAVGSLGASFIAGIVANIMIVLALWFWRDLNEDIIASRHAMKLIYLGWRWAVSIYCLISAAFRLVYANCAFVPFEKLGDTCRFWFEPPLSLVKLLGSTITIESFAFVGVVGGIIYMLYLFVFLAFSLPKTGRVAFRD
ncbi:MAG: DUF3177 family protein [Pseudanabaenaceae cyanobacterium bins.39]|nr:DUF3177 family protein [Pseudanabaenaceae cyanobacterium bins.39]